jgi:hypothetical protein
MPTNWTLPHINCITGCDSSSLSTDAATMGDSQETHTVGDYKTTNGGEDGFNTFLGGTPEGRECLLTGILSAIGINRRPKGCRATVGLQSYHTGVPNHYDAEGTAKKPDLKGHVIVQGGDGSALFEVRNGTWLCARPFLVVRQRHKATRHGVSFDGIYQCMPPRRLAFSGRRAGATARTRTRRSTF